MYYMFYDTPVGTVLFTADDVVLTGMYWKVFKRLPVIANEWVEDESRFTAAIAQLEEYFAGTRTVFTVPYRLKGTDFQRSVWKELEKVAYGKTSSYKAIAAAIGKPNAVRAVGTAVGSNPLSIFVPCHRILTSSSTLGGYAGGLESKKQLLRVESIPWRD